MSFKKYRKYNRTLEKDVIRELVNMHFDKIIEDKLEKREFDRRAEEYFNQEYKREEFIYHYLEKNKLAECNTCDIEECFLYYNVPICVKAGIEVRTISNEKGIYYRIREIPKIAPL